MRASTVKPSAAVSLERSAAPLDGYCRPRRCESMAKDKLRPDIEAARARMRTKAGSGKEIERLVGFMWDDEHVERMTSGCYGVGTGLLVLRIDGCSL